MCTTSTTITKRTLCVQHYRVEYLGRICMCTLWLGSGCVVCVHNLYSRTYRLQSCHPSSVHPASLHTDTDSPEYYHHHANASTNVTINITYHHHYDTIITITTISTKHILLCTRPEETVAGVLAAGTDVDCTSFVGQVRSPRRRP